MGKTWLDSVRKYLDQEKNATSIGANGVRIYFAKSANGQGALNTIVITSTHPNVYPYTDYYIHNPDFTTFLNAVAANPPNYFTEDHTWNDKGSLFFNSKYKCPGEAACASTGQNNIPCQTAYTWVQNFVNPVRKNYQAVNTESELFTIDFIDGLDDELNPTPSSLPDGVVPDGFRIYFAKSMVTSKNLFIIVPTQANGKNTDNTPSHLDNFTCFAMEHVLGPNDNGEQCPNNCDGVTLPQPQ